MPSRSEILLAPIARSARVFEVGPSYSPHCTESPKADGWNTLSIDHVTQQGSSKNIVAILELMSIASKALISFGRVVRSAIPFQSRFMAHLMRSLP
jgi:hypothetical protein